MPTLQSAIYEIRPDTGQTRWYDEALQKVSPRFGPLAVHGVHLLREAAHFAAWASSGVSVPDIEGLPLFAPSPGGGLRALNPEISAAIGDQPTAAAYAEFAVGVLAMADGASAVSQHASSVQSIGRAQTHLIVPGVHADRVEGRLRMPTADDTLLQAASKVESVTVGWTRKGSDITEPLAPQAQISVRQHVNDPTYTSPLVSINARAVVDDDRGFVQADVIDVLYDLPQVRANAPVELLRRMGEAAALASMPWNQVSF